MDPPVPSAEYDQASAESRALPAMLGAVFAATPVGLGFLDRGLRYVRVNDMLAAMNGLPALAHIGRTVREVLPTMAPMLEPLLQRVLETGQETGNIEVSGEPAAHSEECRWWEVNYFPVPGPTGEVALIGAAAVDITAHKRALDALRQNEALLAQVLESLPLGVWIQDATGRITHGNPAGQRIWGGARFVGPEEFGEYKGWWTETGAPIAPDEWAAARAIRYGETLLNELVTIQGFDGSRKTILNSAVPLRDRNGRIMGSIVVNEDVTDRRQAEVELRTQAALAQQRLAELEATYATAPVGLSVLDRELRYVRINDRMAEINGLPAAAHLGRTVREIVPDLARTTEPLFRRILETGEPVLNFEVTGTTAARPGVQRTWLEHWFPLRDAAGGMIGINVVAEEITERKRTEEALRRLHRLEAVGRLAGGMAHEANNQMSVVLGTIAFIERHDLPAEVRRDVEEIRRAAEHTTRVTHQLLAFSRRQIIQPRLVALNTIVRDFEPRLRRALGERIAVEYRLSSEEPLVQVDREQLEQVLLHLALNARDAMPQGGQLTIETAVTMLSSDQGLAHGVSSVKPGRYMLLAVTDTGHGMDRETLRLLFEPFFTTKPVGQGMGLGLSMAYGIVKQTGGYIWADSEPGQGATFRVYLPIAAPEAKPAA